MEPTLPLNVQISDGNASSPKSDGKPPKWSSLIRRIGSKESQRSSQKSFLLWLRLVWLDLLVMICALVIAYFFKTKVPVFRQKERTFAVWRELPDGWRGETYISHSKERLILSNLVAGLLFSVVPIAIILFVEAFIISFWDANTAIFGLVKGLVTTTFVQTVLKILFGAFRPYFLEICKPDPEKLQELYFQRPEGVAGPVWAPVSTCRGEKDAVRAAMQSFPSGHTATASTVGVYLALYLNAKLKAFSDYQTSYWKMIVVLLPLIGAGCVAGLLVIDGNHHLRDVIPSMLIGGFVGYWSYRAQYRSAFLYHTNHFPLPYHSFTGKLRENTVAQQWEAQRALAVRWPAHRNVERLH